MPLTFSDIELKDISVWDEREYSDLQIVSIFSDMDKSELRELPVDALDKASAHLRKILETPTQDHPKRIKIGEIEYGFIQDWTELTGGEYIDMCKYIEEPLKHATKIMAILYRPIVEDWTTGFSIAPYKGTKNHEVFNEVSASYYYGAIGFFLLIMTDSVLTSLQYLEHQIVLKNPEKLQKVKKKVHLVSRLKTLLQKDGGGTTI